MPSTTNAVRRDEIEEALERLRVSAAFERCSGLVRLLRFLLETAEDSPEKLKEIYIGTAYFNREASYDSRADSIVRVNMKRLRQRLADYYATDGKDEPIWISVPVGGYVPAVTRKMAATRRSPKAASLVEVEAGGLPSPVRPDQAGCEAVDEMATNAAIATIPLEAVTRRWGPWQTVVGALILGAAVAFAWRARRATAPALEQATVQELPLTVGRDLEFEPATSADGKRLAYVSRAVGSRQFQIFLRSFALDNSTEQVLDTGPEDALYPAWSPDGQQIAFLRCGHRPCDVAKISVHGGPVHSVHSLPTYVLPDDQAYYQYRQLNPVWTADGRSLIYPYRGPNDTAERLVKQDLATDQVVTLTAGEVADEDAAPALSPDGKTVGFLRRHLAHTDVMTLDLASLKARVLETEPNASTSGLTWAPDGRGVVIGSAGRTNFVLLYVPLPMTLGGAPKPLDIKRQFPTNPVQANDGKTLMFLSLNRSRNFAEVSGNAGQPTPVFPAKQRNTFTALSADEKQLAFLSDRSGAFEIWLSRRQGKVFLPPTQLTHGLGWYPSSITWAPDGHTLAVGISNSSEIEVVNATTGVIDRLRLPGMEHSNVWSPVWSRDGQWIYMAAWGERNGIFRASTSPVPAVEQVWAGRAREVRLDGNRALYFEPNYGQGIYRIPLEGAGPGAVATTAQAAAHGSAQAEAVPQLADVLPARAWLVQDGKLLYIDVRDPVARLHAMNLATGVITDVTGPLPRVAFADGTLSYVNAEHLLVYSEWAEAAGSQIIGLRWK